MLSCLHFVFCQIKVLGVQISNVQFICSIRIVHISPPSMLYISQRILVTSGVRLYPFLSRQIAKHSSTACLFSSNSNNNSKSSAKPQELNARFTSNDPRMPARQRLKNLIAVYGPTAVVLHIGLSLTFLGITYLVVRYGFDVPAFLANKDYFGEKYMMIVANGGTFGLAYALYKLMMPLRVVVTLGLTPKVARTLQTFGIIKRKF